MRKLKIGTQKYTKVMCLDKPGAGGACHEYEILSIKGSKVLTDVSFQNGLIKEAGVNGCMNEDLIAIVIDRLQGFQSGEFRCRENAKALSHLEKALLALNTRTNARIKRGVESTNIV